MWKVKDYLDEIRVLASWNTARLVMFGDAPDVTQLDGMVDLQRTEEVEYSSHLVCEQNPNASEPSGDVHPSQRRLSEIGDLNEDYAQFGNKVQRHTFCQKDTSFRREKNGSEVCRFELVWAP